MKYLGRPFRGALQFLFIAIPLFQINAVFTFAGEPTDRQQFESWWADLEKAEPSCSRALLNFSDKPDQTVAFFKEKLKPLTISADQVKALLAKLGNDDEAVWKPAFDELQYFDPRLAIDIETLMNDVTETPVRQRMVAVLSGYGRDGDSLEDRKIILRLTGKPGSGQYNFFAEAAGKNSGGMSWWAEGKVSKLNSEWDPKPAWNRAVRAITLLEHFRTPGAIAILKDMATGNPDASPTRVAKEALARATTQPAG
jgi:hypothetical protein